MATNSKDIACVEQKAHGYIEDVLSGRIPACRWVKLACQRHLDDLKTGHERGLVFNRERAYRAVKFFSFLKLWKGKEYKGREFVLAPHFVFITWCLMGWYRADGTRRFRKSYIEMARKGAKSTYAGGLGAYFFVADGEHGAEVYCLHPETKILKSDLSWIPISDANVGDELIGFDERPIRPSQYRKLKPARILNKFESFADAIKIKLSDGREIVCGTEHPFICKSFRAYDWCKAKDIRPGYSLCSIGMPWTEDGTKEAGYIAGIFDGEGYFHAVHKPRSAQRIGFTQKSGLVADETLNILRNKKYPFNGKHYNKYSDTFSFSMTGLSNCLRFLGEIKPHRLLRDSAKLWTGKSVNRSLEYCEVVCVEPMGEMRLIDIQTETGTFFAEGFFSHNTAAVKRDQAKIVWDNIRNLTRSSGFSKNITYLTNNLSMDSTHSKCEALASDSKSLDGLDTHFASLDELHAHPTREVHDLIDDSIGARSQPMILIITTAGFNQTGICYETREYLTQILKGTVQDDSFFGIIYTLDTKKDWPELEDRSKGGDTGKELEDDWTDEGNWVKAAPGLIGVTQGGTRYGLDEKGNPIPGYMTKLTDMRDKARIAMQVPSAQNNFLTKRLNIWTQQESRWIDLGLWDQNNVRPVRGEEFQGRACFGGIDLSAVSDMTVWTLLFPDGTDSGLFHVLIRVWCPEARLFDTKNKYRDQYQAWKRQGFLFTTSGDAIDYDFIRAQIVEDSLKFDIDSISVDRLFQGYEFAMKLNEDLGGSEKAPKVYPCGMGHMSMAGPCLEMERLLLERRLNHGGNPVLRFMADCVAVKRDPAGNMKPDKANSGGKIDGIVGILLCLDRKLQKWQPMDDVGVKVIE